MSSFQRLHHWWTQRNRREQAMLAVMFAAVAAFAFWYGMLSPARALREAARRDYSAAVRQLHGRYACKMRPPDCPNCTIRDLCRYPDKTPDTVQAR